MDKLNELGTQFASAPIDLPVSKQQFLMRATMPSLLTDDSEYSVNGTNR